ncbi:hypothetical protein ACFMPD_16590 [Sedimentitalea sp. HM32M-2]|uniref:hypothetical protein n=1 Tax=Sedimentitalea sp. HM32M-2 TaxID=3351566 RepID=UPI003642CA05
MQDFERADVIRLLEEDAVDSFADLDIVQTQVQLQDGSTRTDAVIELENGSITLEGIGFALQASNFDFILRASPDRAQCPVATTLATRRRHLRVASFPLIFEWASALSDQGAPLRNDRMNASVVTVASLPSFETLPWASLGSYGTLCSHRSIILGSRHSCTAQHPMSGFEPVMP